MEGTILDITDLIDAYKEKTNPNDFITSVYDTSTFVSGRASACLMTGVPMCFSITGRYSTGTV